ncbi:MAG: DEAD/DEAH box helicase, partial [Proteobacteria bacterium]|nr:DEAD/DEAH box helicase [Pseudomonadota bacterium]
MASISVDDFYKKDGLIAQVKPGFAQREGQQKLSELIYNQLELGPDGGGEHVLAEGPTGFGKSIALLVPAIVAVLEGKATRVVISTETLALQDQYVTKDLPLLLAAVEAAGYSFTFAAAKGRSNYGCLAKTVGSKDFALTPVQAWLKTQKVGIDTGDLGSVPDLILPDVRAWTDVGADEDCERRGCRFYGDGPKIGKTDCFVYAARRDYLNAQIIVTNHTMLLLDRQHTSVDTPEGPVLGPYDLLIVDEAHTLPEKAAAAWGFELGARTLSSAVRFVQKVLTRMHFECVTDDDVDGFRALETRLLDLFTTYT